MLNGILHLSTMLKDNTFPFWSDCNGTFGSILYSALKEKGFDPESIDVQCTKQTLVIKSTGKTIKLKRVTVDNILTKLNLK